MGSQARAVPAPGTNGEGSPVPPVGIAGTAALALAALLHRREFSAAEGLA